jgi:GTP-binding protein
MNITSVKFIKGVVGPDDVLKNGTPQIAFIGRSNAGKSSLLNSLTGKKKMAITSKTPGRTKEINVFLVNESCYFLDLPGYGYAKAGNETLYKLSELIFWYLLDVHYGQKIVMLVDSVVGPTANDLEVLRELEKAGRDIVIVLNKVDKIKKSQYRNQLKKLKDQLQGHKLFPYSSKTKVGVQELTDEILSGISSTTQ